MSGRSSQAAGGDPVDAFLRQVSNREYGAADRTLSELENSGGLTAAGAARCHDLLRQARRLARDQERLADVVAGLAFDEEHVRIDILRLAAGPQPRGSLSVPARPAAPDGEPPALRIWLLGSCRLSFGGRCLDGGNGDRAAAVLRYLAAQPDTGVHKEQLTDQFWPATNERSARRCLHQVIYNIRRRLQDVGADHELRFINDRYLLGSPSRWRDVDELERTVAAARQACDRGDIDRVVAACQQADQLYAGDFLADHPFDEWANGPRRHYRVLFREATGMLLDRWAEDGRNGRVVDLATRLLGFDPSDEAAARHLMEAQARLGQSQLAAAAYVDLAAALADLGLTPADATRAVAHRILPSRHPVSLDDRTA